MSAGDRSMKTLGCQTKDNDLHMAAHNKLLKIFIQAPIRSELCLRNIYWLLWRMRERVTLKVGDPLEGY